MSHRRYWNSNSNSLPFFSKHNRPIRNLIEWTLTHEYLRDKIRITVQRHEPRLGHVTVSLDAPSGTERMLRFRVDARLEVLPTRPPVSFDARLQLSSNACQVKEN